MRTKEQAIPMARAAHLMPYLEVLYGIGVPVERRLAQAALPMQLILDDSDQLLPLRPAMYFLARVCRDEGIDDLGFRASQNASLTGLSDAFLAMAGAAPTLRLALEYFCRYAHLEENVVDFWIEHEEPMIRICNFENLRSDAAATRCSDWTQNMISVSIIRAFAGPGWSPPEMAFRSDTPICRAARERFPNTRFLTGQKVAWVALPRTMMGLTRLPVGAPVETSHACATHDDDDPTTPSTFAGSLKAVLKGYLCDGYPKIGLAARIVGTSERTVQRNLAREGTTYSELVQTARFELAKEMLADPDHKIIDVGQVVGYDDPSHFSRAFRRVSGLSPREFRASVSI